MPESQVAEKFKRQFGFLPSNGFHEPIDFSDTKIGFSVYKERTEPGFKSLFRVYIKDEELQKPNPVKQLVVGASYGKETGSGITVSSSGFKRRLNWPIELTSDDFFYHVEQDLLFHKKKKISGKDLLNLVDQWHTKPTEPIWGFWLRLKLFWFHNVLAFFFKLIFDICAWMQYLISGERIHIFHDFKEPDNRSHRATITELNSSRGELINIFGYQVQPWVAALYCLSHLAGYGILYNLSYRPAWLTIFFKNDFLTLMYVILSLGFANAVLPNLLRPSSLLNFILLWLQTKYLQNALRKILI